MQHVILGIFAATFALSASATNNLNLSKNDVDGTERTSKIDTSKSNLRDGVKDHGANVNSEKTGPDSSNGNSERAKNAGNSGNAGNARNLNPSKSNVDRTNPYPSRSQSDKTRDMHCSIIQNIKARTECEQHAGIAVSDPGHTK